MSKKRVLSFRREDHKYFATLRGERCIGGVITQSAVKGPLKWYWSLGDNEWGGLFVDGWTPTLDDAREQAEAAGIMLLQGTHPRYGTPFTYERRPNTRLVENP